MKELDIIRHLEERFPARGSVIVGIGDDAAVLRPEGRQQLACKDMLLEGIHFRGEETDAYWIGHKALAVNLSDIAAMGGEVTSAYIALALPRRLKPPFIERLYEGMGALAERFGVSLAGGDTNIWDGPLVVSVSVLGHAHARGPVLRSGAQVGDVICVTGPLGDSYASGHHLRFSPRLEEAKRLLDRVAINSMIDVSDGLGKDLRVLAAQSGLKACLQRAKLPLRASLASLGTSAAVERALNDGEDFELCFTLRQEDALLLQKSELSSLCLPIGTMHPGEGLAWLEAGQGEETITAQGYEHH